MTMRFYVSFGCGYANQAHPSFVDGKVPAMRFAHPDNWIEVDAPNEYEARLAVNSMLGNNGWSMIYEASEWERMHNRDLFFPGRCIARITNSGELEVPHVG
jgi:hypothetical protein